MSYSIIDPDKLVDGQDLDPSVVLANLQAIADAVNSISPTGIPTHNGDPTGVVVPSYVGQLLVDDTTPALYQATGLTNADWELVGGGGGGLPTGWTQDVSNPSNVDAGSGSLSAEANGGTAIIGGNSIGISGAGEFSASRNGITQAGSNSGATFRAVSSHGSTVALDCGGLPIAALPTANPHIVGALWNNGGTPAISAG